ncbi:hypothetical protein P7K49_034310 [Saguinus oedipus]|uniref:Uncharacterized protein n=1 Tax=Saguinus oedipus TaxID=9490 RepID=A0ABQ9TVG8_SAGOE|nr:hypothetical protein P7K49_034310 [Saguinus oedipus]
MPVATEPGGAWSRGGRVRPAAHKNQGHTYGGSCHSAPAGLSPEANSFGIVAKKSRHSKAPCVGHMDPSVGHHIEAALVSMANLRVLALLPTRLGWAPGGPLETNLVSSPWPAALPGPH